MPLITKIKLMVTKLWITSLLLLVIALLLYACNKSEKLNNVLPAVKVEQVVQKIYNEYLSRPQVKDSAITISPIDANLSLTWQIEWKSKNIKEQKSEGIDFIYIPMTPKITGTSRPISKINFRQFLLVSINSNNKINFAIAKTFGSAVNLFVATAGNTDYDPIVFNTTTQQLNLVPCP